MQAIQNWAETHIDEVADARDNRAAHVNGTGQGEAMRSRPWGSWAAAARSSRNSVLWRPRAPAAGTWTGPASDSASRTAPALDSPAAMIQTSRAVRMAGSVSVSRVGGGLGAPCTATT